MKNTFKIKTLTVIIFLFFICNIVKSQNYYAAIGTRLGYGFGITGKWSPQQNLNFVEGMLNFDIFSGKYGRYSGLALTALYERHFEMPRSFTGFNWYLGAGGGTTFGPQFFNLSIELILGLEYSIDRFPLSFSADYKPRIYLLKRNSPEGTAIEPRDAAFSIRYYFN